MTGHLLEDKIHKTIP